MLAWLQLNFVFFLNILRVLVSRVRSADRHIGRQQQYRWGCLASFFSFVCVGWSGGGALFQFDFDL